MRMWWPALRRSDQAIIDRNILFDVLEKAASLDESLLALTQFEIILKEALVGGVGSISSYDLKEMMGWTDDDLTPEAILASQAVHDKSALAYRELHDQISERRAK